MNQIIKICYKHGKLTLSQCIKSGVKNNIQKYKCHECHKIFRKNNYEKNKEKICLKTKKWREENKEKRREIARKYLIKKKIINEEAEESERLKNRKLNLSKRRLINVILKISRVEFYGHKKHKRT